MRTRRLLFLLYCFATWRLRHAKYKYGFDISPTTQIGKGLYIGHFGCLVVNPKAVLGKNVNLSQGVTIGQANRGPRCGTSIIGDNVYIGPGAKIVGAVVIGNDVAIGANAVVTHDVPDHAVVAGVPARVLSMEGSTGYVNHTV